MDQVKLIDFKETEEHGTYLFANTNINNMVQEIHKVFTSEGYKLEEGTAESGIYGKGSPFLRIILGGFYQRFKFKVNMIKEQDLIKLTVTKGMSGASGGVIGYNKMKKESKRIFLIIKSYFE